MMSDTFEDRLSEYLDGELAPAERAAIDAHLSTCENCRGVLEDLQRVIARAGVVQDSGPARDLWPGVLARIGISSARVSVVRRILTSRLSFTVPQLAAAALALMVLSGGLVWMAKSGDPRADFQPLSADSQRPAAEAQTYEETLAVLQKALQSQRANLDPDTRRALDENVAAADRTIEDCRRGLRADPENSALKAQLAAAERRKLSLLRAALSVASRPDR
jgi:predicted anti-sigma-YlaC factor YlaD